MDEAAFIAALRTLPLHPGARGLTDDAAVLELGGETLILTHDVIVAGVHFFPDDPPENIAWKLVAVNMSDLAAKGAEPVGVLMGAAIGLDDAWTTRFVEGLHGALRAFDAPLLGGDTVAMPRGAPVTLGLTAIGRATHTPVPARSGAQAGDNVWVTGTIGDAGLGLLQRQGKVALGLGSLAYAYQRPTPSLALGQDLAPHVSAMADVSDGLLIDAARIAEASGCAVHIALETIPLSSSWALARGGNCEDRIAAASMGDDYRLLFTAPPAKADAILAAGTRRGFPATCIGRCDQGTGVHLAMGSEPVPLPERLGYEHR